MTAPTLSPVLHGFVDDFIRWSDRRLRTFDRSQQTREPLYHYTDAGGLIGIIQTQQIWFTSFLHLNDPTELTFGIEVAHELLNEIGEHKDRRVNIFCQMVTDILGHRNFRSTFGFFLASFSRERNDLGQWRAYGNNGRGFALGLAPRLFAPTDSPDQPAHEKVFVSPVTYGRTATRSRLRAPIRRAVRTLETAIAETGDMLSDKTVGIPFLREMTNALIASQLLLICLTSKHEAYEHEHEVRMFILGQHRHLGPHISTRARGSDLVSFIKHGIPIRARGSVVEIVIGPAASTGTEDALRTLLQAHGIPIRVIRHSKIPYRPT
ncbi:MAG TPA: DUF2971 domain-containing protein [Stellaceae bacterium]|nr:DUF2971 domain-containing protein [Stellaceae bacterium]